MSSRQFLVKEECILHLGSGGGGAVAVSAPVVGAATALVEKKKEELTIIWDSTCLIMDNMITGPNGPQLDQAQQSC
ncbi:hypothetical protein QYF36_003732 [Acer negundo]|nr:hypothetical protein QYF36_003732 [Acer negundo]